MIHMQDYHASFVMGQALNMWIILKPATYLKIAAGNSAENVIILMLPDPPILFFQVDINTHHTEKENCIECHNPHEVWEGIE